MKTVFPADMVCHLWANQSHETARTPTNNLFIRENALFSYGHHFAIGAFIKNKKGETALLFNMASTTSTTNKHRAKAWRALSVEQSRRAYRVPSLDGALIKDPAGVAYLTARWAVEMLEKCEKARENLPVYYAAARERFETARALYIFAGNAKEAATVPAMAEEVSKEGAAAALLAVNRATWLHATKTETAHAETLISGADYLTDPARYNARRVCSNMVRAVRHLEHAQTLYKKAGKHGAPFKVLGLKKKAAEIMAVFEPLARVEEVSEAREDIAMRAGALIQEMALNTRLPRGKYNAAIGWTLSKFRDSVGFAFFKNEALAREMWGKEAPAKMAEMARIKARAERLEAAYGLRRAISNLNRTIYEYTGNPGRAVVPSSRTVSQYVTAETPEFMAAMARETMARADVLAATHAQEVARVNAEKIEAWRAGENVSVSREVPPMVRIKGEEVQTSWGATVPLSHAARLLKVARAIQAKGGQRFEHGQGPAVGYFRVNEVRADFSMVIGCHPFTAEECERAARLIQEATETETAN